MKNYKKVTFVAILIFTFLASTTCQKTNLEDCKLLEGPNYSACVLCAAKKHKTISNLAPNQLLKVSNYSSSSKDAFDRIYNGSRWGIVGGGSGSGSHKNVAFITGYLIRYIVFKHNIISFLDAPCGGVWDSWMKDTLDSLLKDISCFTYQGIDVVCSVINLNELAFSNHTDRVHFTCGDVSSTITSPLPSNYDLILSRDALQHLSYKTIAGVLSNYCYSNATYLLVGSYPNKYKPNKDVKDGAYFDINLTNPPFSFPNPIEKFHEFPERIGHKFLYLYNLLNLCRSKELKEFVEIYRM